MLHPFRRILYCICTCLLTVTLWGCMHRFQTGTAQPTDQTTTVPEITTPNTSTTADEEILPTELTTPSQLLVNTISINEIQSDVPATASWSALGRFTPITRQDVLNYFHVTLDIGAALPCISMIEVTKEHGFYSTIKGAVIPRDSFMFYSSATDSSIVICMQEHTVPKYRIFNVPVDAPKESVIENTTAYLYHWNEGEDEVYYCEFSIHDVCFSIETVNLDINHVVQLIQYFLVQY